MRVMKFGGTSVTKSESVFAIKKLIEKYNHKDIIIVVSALSKITDLLVQLSKEYDNQEINRIISEIRYKHQEWVNNIFYDKDEHFKENAFLKIESYLNELANLPNNFKSQEMRHDKIVSFGETMSSFLITLFLNSNSINAKQVLATECIITDSNFGGAEYIEEETRIAATKTLLPLIQDNCIPVITGFIGANIYGETTVLGRGGSDYSAAIIGWALHANKIQIWTDVDGIYSSDPRVINNAKLLHKLSYKEAAELAMFGAKVLHPKTIQPAVKLNIPVYVLNTFNTDNKGTLIDLTTDHSLGIVKAITWRKTVPVINISSPEMFLAKGFLHKVFMILHESDISVNMLSASEVSVSFTLDNEDKIQDAINAISTFAKTEYIAGYGTLSLVGEKIMEDKKLMEKIFSILSNNNIKVEMLSYGASNINLSMVIPSEEIINISNLLHKEFVA